MDNLYINRWDTVKRLNVNIFLPERDMFHVDPRDVYRLVYYLLSGLRFLCGTM